MDNQRLTVDDLARQAGTVSSTVRLYQSRGLLPPPTRAGRMAFYGPGHLARMRLIGQLQERGFSLAAWVVSWRAPRTAAAVQTLLIVSMHAGGWWFAPARLAHPRRLLVRNAGLLALIWVAATAGDGR